MSNRKIQIPKKDLDSSNTDGKFRIRYRVLSQDKLSATAWSDYIDLVPSKRLLSITGTITPSYTYSSTDGTVTVSWKVPADKSPYVKYYDVYFQWFTTANQDWRYYGKATSTDGVNYSYTAPKMTGTTKARAAAFAATYPTLTNTEINASSTSGKPGYMNLVFNATSSATYINTP